MNCLKCRLQINQPSSAHYGLHPDCFTKWFKTPETEEFVSLQLDDQVFKFAKSAAF